MLNFSPLRPSASQTNSLNSMAQPRFSSKPTYDAFPTTKEERIRRFDGLTAQQQRIFKAYGNGNSKPTEIVTMTGISYQSVVKALEAIGKALGSFQSTKTEIADMVWLEQPKPPATVDERKARFEKLGPLQKAFFHAAKGGNATCTEVAQAINVSKQRARNLLGEVLEKLISLQDLETPIENLQPNSLLKERPGPKKRTPST